VEPNETTAESGEYPLARPLFIYTTSSIMAEKPQVAEYVNFYISNVASQLGTDPSQIGYFPVSKRTARLNAALFLANTAGM
jgi:ABC-type phosphate transport system substrate-binding protein